MKVLGLIVGLSEASKLSAVATVNTKPTCIGCAEAADGQFPWQVSLQLNGNHFCGGSIISSTAIASAAHCKQDQYTVVYGSRDNQAGSSITSNVFIAHPNWNSQALLNDFAVGKMPSSIFMNEFAQPIQLVSASSTRPASGTPLRTSGFGYYQTGPLGRPIPQVSQYLLWTDLNYVSVNDCKAIFTSQTIDSSVVCADKAGASVCSGDSGGPLVMQEDGEWKLLGMTSWGSSRCQVDGFPQAWANVQTPEFNQWMIETADLE